MGVGVRACASRDSTSSTSSQVGHAARFTSNLLDRVYQHRMKMVPGHTAKYNIRRLLWYQGFDQVDEAIAFEKRLKRWRRAWKFELIENTNPAWRDLWFEIAR